MKKVLLTVALTVATFVGANAQIYVGGALGFETNSDKTPLDVSVNKSSFSLAPEVGYYLTDKFDIGLDLAFTTGKYQNDDKFTGWAIAPYARYSFFQFGKFELIGKGTIFFGGEDTDNGYKGTEFGVSVFPVLAYSLTDNVVLFSNLKFAGLNFTNTSPDEGDSYTHFGLGVNANSVVNTGDFEIGFVYKF
jgi:hypothetical protein